MSKSRISGLHELTVAERISELDRLGWLSSVDAELLKQGIECMLSGDLDTGKTVLRDFINSTIGFKALGAATHKSPKSLMRMFGPKGNPQARNLFEVIGYLRKQEGVRFELRSSRIE